MPEDTNELMFGLLKRVHHEIGELRQDVSETGIECIAGSHGGNASDIHNIYGILDRHDDRPERIERRIDLCELAESQRTCEPK